MYGVDVTPTSTTFGQNVRYEDPTCPSSDKWIRTGAIQRYSSSVAGGGDIMQYFMTGNFSDEQGAIETSDYKTGGFRGNFSFRPVRQLEFASQLIVPAR